MHLPIFEFHRCESAKNRYRNFKFSAIRINLIDAAGQICKCSIGDFNFLSFCVLNLWHFFAVGGLDPSANFIDL